MKAFNTFNANSFISSPFNSPKGGKMGGLFPSQLENREQEQQRTAHFIRNAGQKISGSQISGLLAGRAKEEELRRDSSIDQEEESDNHSEVSLLLSQISVPVPHHPDYTAQRLFSLENNITQHILELRQHKIMVMEELSQSIDTKNLYEHYQLKQVNEDERQTNYDSRTQQHEISLPHSPQQEVVPLHISGLILKRNEELSRKLKELQVKEEIFGTGFVENQGAEENKAALEEVLEIREQNVRLQAEIAGKVKNAKDSRFMTFQPQDKGKHQDLIQQSPEELQTLKDKYAQLATENTSSQFKLTEDEMAYVESLREENRQLTEQAEEMLRQKETSNLTRLRQRLSDNQKEKSIFLGQLQKFKQTMRVLKEQSYRLKQELNG